MDHVQKVVYRTIGVIAVNTYALKDVKLMNVIQKMDIVLANQITRVIYVKINALIIVKEILVMTMENVYKVVKIIFLVKHVKNNALLIVKIRCVIGFLDLVLQEGV